MTDIYIVEPDPDCHGWHRWTHTEYNGPPDSRCGSAPTRHEAIDQARECAEDCAAEPEYDPGTEISWAAIQDSRRHCAEDDAMLGAVAELISVLALPLPSDLVLP